jgi:KipI family sensor histidine kinase inhibitor
MHKKILFVYGTLKRGEFHDMSRYDPAPVYLGDGFVHGRLYDLGHCPALELDEKGGPVWGEVFELDASLFEALDRYEAECGDFVLHHVNVQMGDKAIKAYVYESGPNEALEKTWLPEGRWPLKRGVQERDIYALGDQAVLVDFERSVVGPRTELVVGFAQTVRERAHPAIVDVVESPGSVAVYYRPDLLPPEGELSSFRRMKSVLMALRCGSVASMGRQHTIPVCYAPEFGADLDKLAAQTGISVEALITQHLSQTYTVASQGFLPGFAYLEGVPDGLRFPRLGIPRPRVPAGTVAIAENMCGIYPQEGPGGWNLIGRTPIRMFEPRREPPNMLFAGDKVSFRRIALDAFDEVQRA